MSDISIRSYLKLSLEGKRTIQGDTSPYVKVYQSIEWDELVAKLEDARQTILETTRYDVLTSAKFAEHLVSTLCGMDITSPTEKWDLEGQKGTRIEVKLSNSTWRNDSYSKVNDAYLKAFKWANFHGKTKAGKPVHAYVLIGYDNDICGFNALSFYVMPAYVFISQASVTVPLGPREIKTKWEAFRVDPWNVSQAIKEAVRSQKEYIASGWMDFITDANE